jgi:hypothetical protein
LFSVLGNKIVDTYISFDNKNDMWKALEAKFGISNAGSKLYVMKQFHDYKMTDERFIVEQAHELQLIAKEFEQFNCVLLEKFVAASIIAKLPST